MTTAQVVAVTGHRPPKIGGYDPNNQTRVWVKQQLEQWLMVLKPVRTITGMALGVDQDFAELCIELEIPFIAAIPFRGQEGKWPEDAQKKYNELLTKADRVECISKGHYVPWKMQHRNVWMVDNCTTLIAVWDGSAGGTKNCVDYANSVDRVIYRINPTEPSDGRA